VNVFKVNNIDYSIIETNKNNTFVIPNNCFYLSDIDNILICNDLFKTTDSHNYELFLKIKDSEDKLKVIEILKKENNKTEILDLEKEIGKEKLVNIYIEEYLKNKTELHINYNNDYMFGIKKNNNKYYLCIKKYDGEIISSINQIKEENNPYKLLTDFSENYTIYFDETILKYKVSVIYYIESIFKYNIFYPKPENFNEIYTKITDNEIIEHIKNGNTYDIHINLGTECFINKLVDIIKPITFNYKFGEINAKIKLYKQNDKYIITVYGNNIDIVHYYKTGENAYELLNEVLNKYYFNDGFLVKKMPNNNYIKNYLESIVK
jgi:hypothetical protein